MGDIAGGDAALSPPLLALPAPEDVNRAITLDVSTGEAVTLDAMGPVVVNSDGSLSRITNWERMEEAEREVDGDKLTRGAEVSFRGKRYTVAVEETEDNFSVLLDLSGVHALADALSACASLAKLTMYDTNLNAEGARALAPGIARSPSLTCNL